MRKIIIFLLAIATALTLVACDKDKDNGDGKTDVTAPAGEYRLSVNDPYNNLYEPLKASYKAGERVIVKTHILCDATVRVELNGAKPLSMEYIKDESGKIIYDKHEFIMPDKDSVINVFTSGGMLDNSYTVSVNDPQGIIVNDLAGSYLPGDTVFIQTHTNSVGKSSVSFAANKLFVEYVGDVKNSNGEVLCYQWKFLMPHEDVTVDVIISALSYYLEVIDNDTLLYRGVSNYYKAGQKVSVLLTASEVKLYLNGAELNLSLEEVKDENENIIYYKQDIVMPEKASVLEVVSCG